MMIKGINLDLSNAKPYLKESEITYLSPMVSQAHKMIHEKSGIGNDFLGWVDLPVDYDKEEFARIKKAAEKIRKDSDVLIVIGIGGSYLGARAACEMLSHSFKTMLPKNKRNNPLVIFAGNNASPNYMAELLEAVEGMDISVNVISKSGTTLEPALAFRIFRKVLEDKYGKEGARERIYATTDKSKGALKSLADKEGYETFVIPDDVGGRYSVLTPVGLLPIAVSGADIDEMLKGAADARKAYMENDIQKMTAADMLQQEIYCTEKAR